MVPESAATTCMRTVDLPIPGSPPTRVAEPGTSPPPVTRSNSAMPLVLRGGWVSAPLRPTNSMRRPFFAPRPFGALSGACSSTSEFQAWQAGHWPAHFGCEAPHSWQT